jgi:hypothetical protein
MNKLFLGAIALILSLVACSSPQLGEESQTGESGELGEYVQFDINFNRQSGHASNQFAVWIETADGEFVKTIAATKFTANGGYENRPDSLKLWRERGGTADVDAVSSATPSGAVSYRWALDDFTGEPVAGGDYVYYVEGNLRWGNRVIYSGEISVGEDVVCGPAERELILVESDGNPALPGDAPEIEMITGVAVRYADN